MKMASYQPTTAPIDVPHEETQRQTTRVLALLDKAQINRDKGMYEEELDCYRECVWILKQVGNPVYLDFEKTIERRVKDDAA